MIKLVAFDLDGTVADTLMDLAASVNQALSSRGLPTHSTDAYRHFVGNGVDNLMKRALGEHYTPELAEAVKTDFNTYYAAHSMDYTRAYEGMAGLLSRLSGDGILTAVVSNKPDAFVPAILSALYPDHRFDYMSGQIAGIPRKPAPDAMLRMMSGLGVSGDDTLYVGDSDVDVRFAHAAGVRVCGVSWGFRGAEELRSAGADLIADTVRELTEIIYEQA